MSDKSEHDRRMRDLGRFVVPDHRTLPADTLREILGRSRAERRVNAKIRKKFLAHAYGEVSAVLDNGAGLLIDEALREFLMEINDRNWGHGLGSMPTSFNVLEAFVTFDAKENWFGLRPERDHVFALSDFLDFVTGQDAPDDPIAIAMQLPEGIAHSYNAIGDLKALSFLYADGKSFVFGGISFIRFGNELSWVMIGGPITDLKAESERSAKEWQEMLPDFLIDNPKNFDVDRFPKAGAVALKGTDDVWKAHVFGRFNLKTRKHEVRYIAFDAGNRYETISDDPAMFEQGSDGLPIDPRGREQVALGQKVLAENAILTDLASSCFGLPAYFAFKITLVRQQDRVTKLGSNDTTAKTRKFQALAAPAQRVKYRKIASLEIIDAGSPPILRSYTPPRYQVEVDGFWRRLPPDVVGQGPGNESTRGRTWVKAHLRWRDKPPPPRTIYVKSSVAAAKARVAAIQSSSSATQAASTDVIGVFNEPEEMSAGSAGHLYVMRCPAMDDDIYKVGWTAKSPAERALELSRSTGVPLFFVVVESWPLKDARSAELLAHEALRGMRLSTRREFFKAPYETIRAAIRSVIS